MKLLLYCTKSKPYLEFKQIPRTLMEIDNSFEGYRCSWERTEANPDFQINGKIVAECDYEIVIEDTSYNCIDFRLSSSLDGISRLDKSCLTTEQLFDYVKGKNEFYAIHIKNLHIFDEPKELEYFESYKDDNYSVIEKAPQNMMYAYYITKNYADTIYEKPFVRYTYDKYILISIRPEWLCKILNGEKTIEVRKKVLREMIK